MAVLDNYLRIRRDELNVREWKKFQSHLQFCPKPNRVVYVWKETRNGYLVPRGTYVYLPEHVRIEDRRSFPKLPKLKHKIKLDATEISKLYEGQSDAVLSAFEKKQGVILRQPGSGKTNIAVAIIAGVGTRSLVIVHTEDILRQWKRELTKKIPGIEIGTVRQTEETIGHVTLATIQTLFNRDFPTEWWRQFGLTILDEAHHAPARTFEDILNNSTSRYRLGLTASETRSDSMEPLAYMVIGPIIHEKEFESTVPVTVKRMTTSFTHKFNPVGSQATRRWRWTALIERLVNNLERNQQIADEVDSALDDGRSTLVLSRRIEHLANIKKLMRNKSVIMAASGPFKKTKEEREEIITKFRAGKIKCVLATQLADEALDVPILSCVCLAFPGKHSDKILQQVGRGLREHPRKHSVLIIDVVDIKCKVLRSQWHERRQAYMKWSFQIQGSAIDAVESYGRILINKGSQRRKVIVRKVRPVKARNRRYQSQNKN